MIERKIVLIFLISLIEKEKSKLFSSIERDSISNESGRIAKFFSPKENKNMQIVESSYWISMSPESKSFYLAF